MRVPGDPASRAGASRLSKAEQRLRLFQQARGLPLGVSGSADRAGTEAGYAALCGSAPVRVSSGKTNRHRLNRGGNRQANAALHRAVIVRLRWHEPTQAYMARRRSQGMTGKEIMRCLKRYIAREIYHALARPKQATNDLSEAA